MNPKRNGRNMFQEGKKNFSYYYIRKDKIRHRYEHIRNQQAYSPFLKLLFLFNDEYKPKPDKNTKPPVNTE